MYSILGIIALLSPVFGQLREIDVACGRSQPLQLRTVQKDIYSPGFQENRKYPPNTQCTFYLQVPAFKKVLLEIKSLDIEASDNCGNDFLRIENPHRSITFGQFCGSNITEKMLISTDTIMIAFLSDGIVSGRGFHLSYQVTTQTSLCAAKQLQCKNNKCVPSSAICNLKDDCGDGTDEENCRQIKNQKAECGIPKIPPVLDISSNRIVGGQEAVHGSWPWQADLQVAIIHPNGHQCGGSLINSQWVVSAAHCFLNFRSSEAWRIHLGNHNKFDKDPQEQIRYAKNVFFYNSRIFNGPEDELLNHDIVLIKLNAEVDFTSHVSPICIPPQGFELKLGTKCYSSGWGQSRGSGFNSVLKQVPIKTISPSKCNNPHIRFNQQTMVCTDAYEDNGGICHGDSGGPLVCQVENKWYLIGISSFGTDSSIFGGICGVDNVPNVYQKVSSKTTWIQNVIRTYG